MIIFLFYEGHCCFSAKMNRENAGKAGDRTSQKGAITKLQKEKNARHNGSSFTQIHK